MDTVGLLAAWVGVVSCLCGILLAIGMQVSSWVYQRLWAKTSRTRAQRRLDKLLLDLDAMLSVPDNTYLANLISMYGSMILNLVAAVGLVMISIEILDLGPALLAATLPFNINSRLLTRFTGILVLVLSYYFILRLCYLAMTMRITNFRSKSANGDSLSREISRLRARLGLPD
jgi:hypothetical protein